MSPPTQAVMPASTSASTSTHAPTIISLPTRSTSAPTHPPTASHDPTQSLLATQTQQQLDSLRTDYAFLLSTSTLLNTRITSLTKDLSNARSDLANALHANAELNRDLDASDAEKATLHHQILSLEASVQSLSSVVATQRESLEAYETWGRALEVKIARGEMHNAGLVQELGRVSVAFERVKRERGELVGVVGEQGVEIEVLRERCEGAEGMVEGLVPWGEEQWRRAEGLLGVNKALEEEIGVLVGENRRLAEENRVLKAAGGLGAWEAASPAEDGGRTVEGLIREVLVRDEARRKTRGGWRFWA